jgi:hypothetical protein
LSHKEQRLAHDVEEATTDERHRLERGRLHRRAREEASDAADEHAAEKPVGLAVGESVLVEHEELPLSRAKRLSRGIEGAEATAVEREEAVDDKNMEVRVR